MRRCLQRGHYSPENDMTPETNQHEAGSGCPTPTCSASTSAELYRLLEYYRKFMPFCVGTSEKEYSETQEAKNADAALNAYREETGAEADTKPSEPNAPSDN